MVIVWKGEIRWRHGNHTARSSYSFTNIVNLIGLYIGKLPGQFVSFDYQEKDWYVCIAHKIFQSWLWTKKSYFWKFVDDRISSVKYVKTDALSQRVRAQSDCPTFVPVEVTFGLSLPYFNFWDSPLLKISIWSILFHLISNPFVSYKETKKFWLPSG